MGLDSGAVVGQNRLTAQSQFCYLAVMTTATELAQQLVDACNAGREATTAMQDAIYSTDATSTEAMGPPGEDLVAVGLEAIKGKGEWWYNNHEIHTMEVEGPFVNGDNFCVIFALDATPKAGPMEGQRFSMREVAHYATANGKIVAETFLMPPMG